MTSNYRMNSNFCSTHRLLNKKRSILLNAFFIEHYILSCFKQIKIIMIKCIMIFILLIPVTFYSQNWLPLGSGMNSQVTALTVYNGELIAGGDFTMAGGVPVNSIAKWNGTSWSPLGSGIIGVVNALTVYNNELIAGGHFFTAGAVDASCIAKWNGASWSPLGTGVNYYVTCLTVHGNELVAGGAFSIAGGVPASAIAHWNGNSWGAYGSGMPNIVNGAASVNDSLFLGGNFFQTFRNTGKWTGSGWVAIGNQGCNLEVKALLKRGNELILGGLFSGAGPITASRIVKWTGSNFESFGSGVNNYVNCLAATDSFIVAGGFFTIAGGVPASKVARWRTSWEPMGAGLNDEVFALTVYNGEVISGGLFTQSGSTILNYIGRFSQLTPINTISSYTPVKTNLNQNYPNPFNPLTKITFDISDKGFVRLEIFDAAGRIIKVLVDDELAAGSYDVSWDASGSASGIYYSRLITGNCSLVNKMILLK